MKMLFLLLLPLISHAQDFNSCVVDSIIQVESAGNSNAINEKTNCFGLMQVQLATARVMGFRGTSKDLMKPIVNKYYGSSYIQFLIKRYNNQLYKALDAYNRGYGNVDKFPYKGDYKNHHYVGLIINNMEKLCPQFVY